MIRNKNRLVVAWKQGLDGEGLEGGIKYAGGTFQH